MEKLKAKHDHTLTDILKVLIFAIVLLIPGFMFLPSMLYFGFNEQANAPIKQVQIQEDIKIDFNQKYTGVGGNYGTAGIVFTKVNDYTLNINGSATRDYIIYSLTLPTLELNNIYYVRYVPNTTFSSGVYGQINIDGVNKIGDIRFTYTSNARNWSIQTGTQANAQNVNINISINIFNLTQMFGDGNEPTIEQFNTYFTNSYYPYTDSQEIVLTVDGSTEEVVDITTQLEWNWEQIWQRPILSWTKYSILKQGLDAFTNVFGVLQTSYITNLIAYELIMVAIYIVIDIVITMFKWLTHSIGTK